MLWRTLRSSCRQSAYQETRVLSKGASEAQEASQNHLVLPRASRWSSKMSMLSFAGECAPAGCWGGVQAGGEGRAFPELHSTWSQRLQVCMCVRGRVSARACKPWDTRGVECCGTSTMSPWHSLRMGYSRLRITAPKCPSHESAARSPAA